MKKIYFQFAILFFLLLSVSASKAQIITTIAGTGSAGYNGDNIAATTALLNQPPGLTVDNAGNIIIADFLNNRIRKISTTGIVTTMGGTGSAGYNGDNIEATTAQRIWK